MKNSLLPSPLFWAVSRRGGSLLGWVSHFKHYDQENSSLRLITDPIKLATKINHLVNRVAPAVPGARENVMLRRCVSPWENSAWTQPFLLGWVPHLPASVHLCFPGNLSSHVTVSRVSPPEDRHCDFKSLCYQVHRGHSVGIYLKNEQTLWIYFVNYSYLSKINK